MNSSQIRVSAHAITRYKERVKPGLEWEGAKLELEALIETVGRICDYPDWTESPRHGSQFMELSDGLGAVIVEGVITTIVCRGGMHPKQRARKNEQRSQKRPDRKTKSKNWKRRERAGRPEEILEWL